MTARSYQSLAGASREFGITQKNRKIARHLLESNQDKKTSINSENMLLLR